MDRCNGVTGATVAYGPGLRAQEHTMLSPTKDELEIETMGAVRQEDAR